MDRSTTETEATRERKKKKKKKKKMERGGKGSRPEEKREWQEKAIAGVARRMDKGSKVRQFKDDKQRPRQGRS